MNRFSHQLKRKTVCCGLALAMFTAGFSAQAEDRLVENTLGKSAGLIQDIQHYCPPKRAAEGIAGYTLTNEKYLPENFGNANEFGTTRHIYSTARTSESDIAIIIDNLEPRHRSRHCGAIIIIDSNGGKVKIKSSFRKNKDSGHFSAVVSEAANKLMRLCEGLSPAKAASYFSGGVSSMTMTEDGQIVSIPDMFFCDSAAKNSLSSIDVSLGETKVRISFVYSKIFLEEIEQ